MGKRWHRTKDGGETARFIVWVTREDYDLAKKYAKEMNRDGGSNWSPADALASMLAEGALNVSERLDDYAKANRDADEEEDE